MPSDEDFYHISDRYSIIHSSKLTESTSIKPFNRNYNARVAYEMRGGKNSRRNQFPVDRYNSSLLSDENWEADTLRLAGKTDREKWTNFYQYRGSFFSVDQPDFKLVVNPVLAFDMGQDIETSSQVFRNTRGLELRGNIADKLGFYSFISENQFRFPTYYNDQIDRRAVIPGAGFIKDFGSGARDFFVSRGYITARPIKQVNIQFGHDRNFIGNGYRSLIMSDFAKENLFLKLHTQVWRIQYINLFSEYTDYASRSGSNGLKKYGAFHYLNLNIIPGKLDVGVFEHIIFFRENQGYETQYLNPIIFYRSVEHGLNSSDNALIGMDWKYNPTNRTSFYGQFVLDEFHKNELINRTGSWVNKWAFQAGGKWIDAFNISNLDLQFETNLVRPYTYTHKIVQQSYTHYNQAIAHPMGSNFKEVLGIIRYQPKPKWTCTLKIFSILHGADSSDDAATTHFGGDLLKDYENRPADDGLSIGQGLQEKILITDFALSYQVYHRTFIDLRYVYRNSERDSPLQPERNSLVYIGFRMNIDKMKFDF